MQTQYIAKYCSDQLAVAGQSDNLGDLIDSIRF